MKRQWNEDVTFNASADTMALDWQCAYAPAPLGLAVPSLASDREINVPNPCDLLAPAWTAVLSRGKGTGSHKTAGFRP